MTPDRSDSLPMPAAAPVGSIVLHVGVHKTGTTGLQSALAAARPQLLEHGVLYPGDADHHHVAALSVMERRWGWRGGGGRTHSIRHWKRLARQSRSFQGTVALSSEFLCRATPETIERIVRDLGAERLRIVITARNLGHLLASSWQQSLKSGHTKPYDRWLRTSLSRRQARRDASSFWRRNDYPELVRRWADAVGMDRITLLVGDEANRGLIYRRYEHLLGLPDGVLQPSGRTNRSMTWPEAQFVLSFNRSARKRFDWDAYERMIRRGAIQSMVEGRKPAPDEQAIPTPAWALRRVAAMAADDVAHLRVMSHQGLVVVGDLDSLAARLPAVDVHDAGAALPIDAAVHALLGATSAPPAPTVTARIRRRVARQARSAEEE